MSKKLTKNWSADDILEVIYTLGEAAAEYRGLTHEGYGSINDAERSLYHSLVTHLSTLALLSKK